MHAPHQHQELIGLFESHFMGDGRVVEVRHGVGMASKFD
jgi:hypothetical protein